MAIPPGLYEQVISADLQKDIDALAPELQAILARMDPAESHFALAQYVGQFLNGLLRGITGSDKLEKQIAACNRLIDNAAAYIDKSAVEGATVNSSGDRLLEIVNPLFTRHPKPETPLSVSSLLTATSGDPSLVSQLKQEILHADQIDILVSFIKWSGIRIIKDELEEFANHGRLRIITTSYLGATDLKAIRYLLGLPNTEVRVSFDTKRTRLHAKAYIFHRNSGFGTAYVGSSNISNPAMTDGLEWNVKICQYETPHLWHKINATFETYQLSKDFEKVTSSDLSRLDKALRQEKGVGNDGKENHLVFFDITPYPYQQEILDKLKAERLLHNRNRNLVVAATGTGKTVIAAFDFKQFQKKHRSCRLLFVVHREEILHQARAVFRNILRDQNFGELWVGTNSPDHLEQLFISVQTFRSQKLWQRLSTQFYDYIIIDETHHAPAGSYSELTSYFTPQVLLGLTATPERADGEDILKYFDHRICAEIRLPDAINRKLLSPFQYFCITDCVDYSRLTWQRGGYVQQELGDLITGNHIRVELIIQKAQELLLDINSAKSLCFCVNKKHAHYMAEQFQQHGVQSMALTADTPDIERKSAIAKLKNGEVNFLCVVDLFNEGVDIPEIDTVLFLRPTESLTVFLQQLGRGLRLCEDKEHLTVLDFVGQAHQKFNFEARFRALLGRTSSRVEDEIEAAFPSLPSGCVIEMEKEAQRYILDNIRHALTHANKNQLICCIGTFTTETGLPLNLSNFIRYHRLELDDIYKKASWARLCAAAGVREDFEEPDEKILSKGLRRMCSHNSSEQLRILRAGLQKLQNEDAMLGFSDKEKAVLTMFLFTIWNNRPPETSFEKNLVRLAANPTLATEAGELAAYLLESIDTLVVKPDLPYFCPLSIHGCYTRDEILAALGYLTFERRVSVREGVKYLPYIKTDIFFITLNKTEKDYSPTTMYDDYALDESHFHWQSQSTTSETSPTGMRYIHHQQRANHVLLFVREMKKKNNLACPYYFLGPADYVSHTGSKPMSIIWRLQASMPGRLIRTTTRLAAA
ncbi:DUF3427 domain-containing protein [Desulfobacterota bacterium M19]